MFFRKTITALELKEEFIVRFRDCYKLETYEGLINYYIETFSASADEEIDVVDICTNLTEESYAEVVRNCSIEIEYDAEEDEEEQQESMKKQVVEYLNYHTTVIAEGNDFVSYIVF